MSKKLGKAAHQINWVIVTTLIARVFLVNGHSYDNFSLIDQFPFEKKKSKEVNNKMRKGKDVRLLWILIRK